jgi:hypothetical protein
MSWTINSPFASLSSSLFSPQDTARSVGASVNSISNAMDPLMRARQADGRGVSKNLFDVVSPMGAAAVARQVAPVAQRMGDASQNADWALKQQTANSNFANNAYGMMGQQDLNNQRYGRNAFDLYSNLFGGLFG